MQELADLDFQINDFIFKNEPVSKEDIKSHFPKISSIDYRLNNLLKKEQHGTVIIPGTSIIEEQYEKVTVNGVNLHKKLNLYVTTNLGKTILQNYLQETKSYKRDLWIKNAWLPIIVSFVTTCISMYILPKLPLILKWFANILSKIFS